MIINLKTILFIFSFLLMNIECYSQQVQYYSDVFYGGVTGGGYNPGFSQESGILTLNVPNNTTIRKVLLFFSATKFEFEHFFPSDHVLVLNETEILLDTLNSINNNYILTYETPNSGSEYITIISDITNYDFLSSNSSIQIIPPNIFGFPIFWEYYLLVLYEDNSLKKTAIDVYINHQNSQPTIKYNLFSSFPLEISNNVGLAINTSSICDTIQDGSYVFVNDYPLGLIGGNEIATQHITCSSPSASFYYENDTLYGLTDDTPDTLMRGSDVLANIQNYSLSTPIHINFEYQSSLSPRTNIINQLFLTYTTPCDTFSVSVPSDTTICYGETLQLPVSGGQSYEWTAVSDTLNGLNALNCSDCPNPVFSGESSQVYTVRIWNNDSCSVVRPVRVWVSHPEVIQTSTTNSICELANGKIMVHELSDKVMQIGAVTQDGDTLLPNSNNVFTNLAAGDYTVFYVDKYGCSADTVVTVTPIINTVAQFNAFPKKGAAPLWVNITNQSQHATDYSWSINEENQGNNLTSFLADTSGVYSIQLIAWNNKPMCADTVMETILVHDSVLVYITEVFSPNSDGKNEVFYIENLEDFPNTKVWIYNRWGTQIFYSEDYQNDWNGTGKNGKILPEGTYYYVVELGGIEVEEKTKGIRAGWVYLKGE